VSAPLSRTSSDRRGSTNAPERQLVLFAVGAVVYGLPIDRVREVVNPQPTFELPHAPPSVIGVADHRGEVVPVIDLRSRFGLPPLEEGDAKRKVKWILVDVAAQGSHAPRIVATVVDMVHNVYMTREPLRPPPPLGGGEDRRGIAGVLSRAALGFVFVLDLDPLRAIAEPVSSHHQGIAP
jgi:purine-binding chemotaxis protein CheW